MNTRTATTRQNPEGVGVRGLVTFLILTFALSAVFFALIVSGGGMEAGGGLLIVAGMWSPGIAAIATALTYRRSLRGFGWGLGKVRYLALGYALPLLYAGGAYLVVWATGLGTFYRPEGVAHVAGELGLAGWSAPVVIAVWAAATLLVTIPLSAIPALGEEIGWRGFLVPELAKVTGLRRTALFSGAVWVVWHAPIVLSADYNAGTPGWYGFGCFALLLMGLSVAFAWLRLRSGSLWPAVILHAGHNAVIQSFLNPITGDTGPTPYLIGEFGLALALAGVVMGIIFWRKLKTLEPEARNARRAETRPAFAG
jgi:membrane protease YdiL (CAAX protease family)